MSANRLQFSPDPVTLFVKVLLTSLATIIFVPAPKLLLELVAYVMENLQFADGTRARCEATIAQVSQPLMIITGIIWANIILSNLFKDPLISVVISLGLIVASAYAAVQLYTVLLGNTVTSNGSRLRFLADLPSLLKWQVMIWAVSSLPSLLVALLPLGAVLKAVLILPVVLLSLGAAIFVMFLFTQWLVTQVGGGSRSMTLRAEMPAFCLHYLGFVVFSLLLITIPWSVAWFTKWLGSQTEIPARGMATTA